MWLDAENRYAGELGPRMYPLHNPGFFFHPNRYIVLYILRYLRKRIMYDCNKT